MADIDGVTDKLYAAIAKLAHEAETQNVGRHALAYAQAANQLAEALAWLESPNQPHGGGAVATD